MNFNIPYPPPRYKPLGVISPVYQSLKALAALLFAALLLAGCENTAGAAGDSGQSGKDVSPRRLTGSKTTSIIQHEIDSNANLVFEGCVQSDEGMVSIPANRKVELVGTKAYQPHASGCLIIAETASVTGTGKIAEVKGAVFIAPQAVLDTNTGIGTDTTKIAYQTIGTEGAITFRDNIAAVNGNATIGSTGETGTTIPATSLNGKTLYVVGNLTVSNAVTAELIAVGGGGGNVTASAKITGAVNATGDVSFTGSVEQNGLTALAADSVESEVAIAVTGAASFGGAAAFGNTVSFGDEVSFGGDVTVTEEGVLTLTSGGAVTLAARKSIKVGNDAVLTAGSAGAVLTPGGAATLTPDLANKKLTLDAANLALTSGTLTVPAGATLELGDVLTVEAGAELAAAGDVTVAESDGGLTLTGAESTGGAKLSGAGKVTLGFGHITGGASGAWQAVGEETSIAFAVTSDIAASITGTGTGPVLAGLANDSAVITLAKGHTNGNAIALTVTNATIDISTKGAVAFPYVATTPATLVLQGGTDTEGKLKLGEGDTTNSNAHLTNGGHSVTISGTSHVIKGATSDAGAVAGIISGGETATSNDAVITGKTGDYDVTIKAGATLASS